MNAHDHRELLQLSERLLECIRDADWDSYQALCDPALTCFEPEARGHLVEGLEFHRFYFESGGHLGRHASTLCAPHVRPLGADAAVVCYTRLVQRIGDDGRTATDRFEETRVWQRRAGTWRHVHFHRSAAS